MLTKEQEQFLIENREVLTKLLPLKEEQLTEKRASETDEKKKQKDKEKLLKLVNSMSLADVLKMKKLLEEGI